MNIPQNPQYMVQQDQTQLMESFGSVLQQQQQQPHQQPQQPTLLKQPKSTSGTSTFVHKLFNMVLDNQYQHLIAWSYTGTSFVVCNIMEFSRDVLPKHFKHNNFSSFVRQLNMYGFHKVNKSPRGHRTSAENQIWEFSHPKFIQNRTDLLDDIKRKTMEADTSRKDTRDLHGHMTMMQVSHSDMMQRVSHLFENYNQLVKELSDTKKRMTQQEETMRAMMEYIASQNGGQLPSELGGLMQTDGQQPPPIFVTSHEPMSNATEMNGLSASVIPDMFARSSPMDIQTDNRGHSSTRPMLVPSGQAAHSPASLGSFGSFLPPSPCPSSMVYDDDSSLYSPHSPHTPHHHTIPQPASSLPSHSMHHRSRSTGSLNAFAHKHHDFAYSKSVEALGHR